MRKAQYIKPDRPLLVTVSELQGYVGLPSHATDTDFRIKTEHGEMAER